MTDFALGAITVIAIGFAVWQYRRNCDFAEELQTAVDECTDPVEWEVVDGYLCRFRHYEGWRRRWEVQGYCPKLMAHAHGETTEKCRVAMREAIVDCKALQYDHDIPPPDVPLTEDLLQSARAEQALSDGLAEKLIREFRRKEGE